MALVTIEHEGAIAVVTIDNPPVNALSNALRAELMAALGTLEAPGVRGAVLICAGRTFIVGADIRELDRPREILTATIAAHIEALDIPVVAALHGTALGGGLEVALGCHARVMQAGTQAGLPEVHLGLISSGGGTQRLPRVVGALAALDLLASGRRVNEQEARQLGLADAVVEDLRAGAVAHARVLAAAGPPRRTMERPLPRFDRAAFEQAVNDIRAAAHGALAPVRAAELVTCAVDRPPEEGFALEQTIAAELLAGPQSRALRYLFAADRAARDPAPAPEVAERLLSAWRTRIATAETAHLAVVLAEIGIHGGPLAEPPADGGGGGRPDAAALRDVLAAEGARLVAAGIAARASDIDVVAVRRLGYPAWRGGPMHETGRAG